MCSRGDSACSAGVEPAIRVLHLVSTFEIKTDTKWLVQLIGRLPRDRFEPAIACMYGDGPMRARFAEIGVATFNLDAAGEISPGGLLRLRRLIRTLSPDILHTHLLRADLYGGLTGRMTGVPVVLSTAYGIGRYRRDKVRRLDGMLDWLCRHLATHALAVSDAVRADLVDARGWAPQRVSVIHTGKVFSESPPDAGARSRARQRLAIPQIAPLVVTVARLSYEKGIDVLIGAARRVRQRVAGVRFVVLGDGPLREALMNQIRTAGLDGAFELAGFRPDVDAVLAGADVFVLASHMEGMPNAVLEAYDAGLPVVVTSAGGLPEAVRHGETGLVVAPGDEQGLADGIVELLEDADLRRQLAERGRAWACERFALDRVARQYAALYESLHRLRGGTAVPHTGRRVLGESISHSG